MNELHFAAGKKDGLAEVKRLIEKEKVDIKTLHTETKLSPVAYAAFTGSRETLEYLISACTPVDIRNLLFLSLHNPDTFPFMLEYCKKLPEAGTIFEAAALGDLKKIQAFNNLDQTDQFGFNTLFYAMLFGQDAVIELLIKPVRPESLLAKQPSLETSLRFQLLNMHLLIERKSSLINMYLSRTHFSSRDFNTHISKLFKNNLLVSWLSFAHPDLKIFLILLHKIHLCSDDVIQCLQYSRLSISSFKLDELFHEFIDKFIDNLIKENNLAKENNLDLKENNLALIEKLIQSQRLLPFTVDKVLFFAKNNNHTQLLSILIKNFTYRLSHERDLNSLQLFNHNESLANVKKISLLFYLIATGKAEVLSELDKKTKLNFKLQNSQLMRPLHVAALMKDNDWKSRIEYLLLKSSAFLFSTCNYRGFTNVNILHIAIMEQHFELMKYLIEKNFFPKEDLFDFSCSYKNEKVSLTELAISFCNLPAFKFLKELNLDTPLNYVECFMRRKENLENNECVIVIRDALLHPNIHTNFSLSNCLSDFFKSVKKSYKNLGDKIINLAEYIDEIDDANITLKKDFSFEFPNFEYILFALLSHGAGINYSFSPKKLEILANENFKTVTKYILAFFSGFKPSCFPLPDNFIVTKQQFITLADTSPQDAQALLTAYSWYILGLFSQNKSPEKIKKHETFYSSLHASLYNEPPSLFELSTFAFFGSSPNDDEQNEYHSMTDFSANFIQPKKLTKFFADKSPDKTESFESPHKKFKNSP